MARFFCARIYRKIAATPDILLDSQADACFSLAACCPMVTAEFGDDWLTS